MKALNIKQFEGGVVEARVVGDFVTAYQLAKLVGNTDAQADFIAEATQDFGTLFTMIGMQTRIHPGLMYEAMLIHIAHGVATVRGGAQAAKSLREIADRVEKDRPETGLAELLCGMGMKV